MKTRRRGQRYSTNLSLISALHGTGRSTPSSSHFTPRKETRYPFYRKLGGPLSISGSVGKISPIGVRTRTVRTVPIHCTIYDIPAAISMMLVLKCIVSLKSRWKVAEWSCLARDIDSHVVL